MYGSTFSGVPKGFHSDPGKVTFLTLIQLLIIPVSLQVHIKFMCKNTFLQPRSSTQPGITEHLNLKHNLHLVKYICICTCIYMYIYAYILGFQGAISFVWCIFQFLLLCAEQSLLLSTCTETKLLKAHGGKTSVDHKWRNNSIPCFLASKKAWEILLFWWQGDPCGKNIHP